MIMAPPSWRGLFTLNYPIQPASSCHIMPKYNSSNLAYCGAEKRTKTVYIIKRLKEICKEAP